MEVERENGKYNILMGIDAKEDQNSLVRDSERAFLFSTQELHATLA